MQPLKRPKFPLILAAHDLLDGEVVFIGHQHWSADRHTARILHDDEAADAAERIGKAGLATNQLVDLEWVGVTETIADDAHFGGAHFEPRDVRERYKMRGPSVRPDLGKQAGHATAKLGTR